VLLNTIIASQTITIRNEILGSSDGTENQIFRTTRSPILIGQQLEVREPEMPSAQERERIEKEEGEKAISFTADATGRPQEIWVCWHEVPDFYGSGSRDRHYVLDHLTGEIQFGDGLNGLIPPIGTGNLRLTRYQTGGGTAGNKPAGTIVQLKTTVPYVDKVTNTEAATGGADAETLDSLRDRVPRTIRHNGRAVTLEDYEDLAMLASPAVARTKCIPLLNLLKNPLEAPNAPGQPPKAPGEVSVIIVPRSTDTKPLPSLELMTRVQNYLEANSLPTVNISVVGPLYISVNVTTEIALTSLEGASAVEQAVEQKLANFLHPLTGGLDGTGWAFGREPYRSDFYALIEAIPGVDHVRSLDVKEIEDQPGAKETGRFLVYSGRHKINLFFGET
jgi:predicted phage baseplate assembly protein